MSDMENISLEKQVVYELCVRNFNKEGTFDSLRQELKRIWAMGVDIICLLPVYNMEDPENPDPELGDEEQFQALVEAIHRYRMKCVLDVTLTGEVGSVEAAVERAKNSTDRLIGTAVIPHPSKELLKRLA